MKLAFNHEKKFERVALAAAAVAAMALAYYPHPTKAQEDVRARIDQMGRELKEIQTKLDNKETKTRSADKKSKEADESLVKWHLSGYAYAEFVSTDSKDAHDTFNGAHFSPIFHFQYGKLILFEAEPELAIEEDQETELELEYAQINLLLHDSFVLGAGKYLSPVGQFQERLHPAWINKLPDAPAGYSHHGGIQPASDIGVQARGGIPLGNMTATYAVAVGNGPQINDEGFVMEGFGQDDNSNKAVSGRIGFLPLPYLEVGGSFMFARAEGWEGPNIASGSVSGADFRLWGVDAAFTRGPWDVRFEYLNGKLDSHLGTADEADTATSLIPKTTWEAWYVQAAYQLSGLTDIRILRNFEPVVRYGEYTGDGADRFLEMREHRFNIGLNYLFAPSIIAKGSVEWRDMKAPGVDDETRFILQLAYGF